MKDGIYEEIVNKKILNELNNSKDLKFETEKLDPIEAKFILTNYIANITKLALKYLRDDYSKDDEYLFKQIEVCNEIIDLLKKNLNLDEFEELKITEQANVLLYVYNNINNINYSKNNIRPETSISRTSLFIGSKSEPCLMEEIKKEIFSSDEICLLISFIKWTGLVRIIEELKEYTERGKKLRIITTSYMGATDFKAIDVLSKLPNTEIKISYDVKRTRLHAKSYIFKRYNGFTTAYVGSSNMSSAAMISGLEWNVKLTEKESFEIINKINASFDTYWNDSLFETYNSLNSNKLIEALNYIKKDNNVVTIFDIKPYAYQQEILDNLEAERKIFNRNRNLVVAATGVGKTVIAAFDYKRFREKNKSSRILFVAHRKEILEKSLFTFRQILKDLNFGELLVGEYKPNYIDNLFISIQSLNSSRIIEKTTPDFYDYIVIDEAHHGAANSYKKLLEYYKPKILLGLTATPERMDGLDITKYFDGKIAYEMRLTEAIDNKLLSPFQYFGVSDSIDLSNLKWKNGGYDVSELENVYVFDTEKSKIRANNIIENVYKYVADINAVKGLGFCASIKHAEFMCDMFNKSNIPSIYLTGNSDKDIRKDSIDDLKKGKIKFIFTVDLFNEGVDIAEINTILFLRPTESLTIFLQQLGRGLRLCDNKECLTVLDFIGQCHKNYNFIDKFRGLVGKTNNSIESYVENGFSYLPKGCYIKLEKQAREYVLRNIAQLKNIKKILIDKIKYFESDTGLKLNLINFIKYNNISIEELYKFTYTFTGLYMQSREDYSFNYDKDKNLRNKIKNLLSVDSPKLLMFMKKYIDGKYSNLSSEELILKNMMYYTFYNKVPKDEGFNSIDQALSSIFLNKYYKEEINDLINLLFNKINCVTVKNSYDFICPLEVYSTYTRSQILAGLNFYNEKSCGNSREGVLYLKDKDVDLFFVTLNKSSKNFSENTLYEDYAISNELFHWQSQNRATSNSNTVQRYIKSKGRISLFVRENKYMNDGKASPYIYLGECNYVSHNGNRPVSFIFKLKNKIPGKYISKANKNII